MIPTAVAVEFGTQRETDASGSPRHSRDPNETRKLSMTTPPSPEIQEFSFRFASNKIENYKLQGQVFLDLLDPLEGIKSIDLRFVGGIKTSHKRLLGYTKLFDSKLTLCEASSLEPTQHKFDFEMCVPNNIPNSVNHSEIKVEYLLICVIGFQNGCCGLVPIFQRNPITLKKHLQLVSMELLETYDLRMGHDVTLMEHEENSYLIWNPTHYLLVKMNPLQAIDDWHFRLQLDLNYVIDKIEYGVFEQTLFKYE
jgi:hypothetical protein